MIIPRATCREEIHNNTLQIDNQFIYPETNTLDRLLSIRVRTQGQQGHELVCIEGTKNNILLSKSPCPS